MNDAIKLLFMAVSTFLMLGVAPKANNAEKFRMELFRADSMNCRIEAEKTIKGIYTLKSRVKEYVNSLPVKVVDSPSIQIKETSTLGTLTSRHSLIEEANRHLGKPYKYGSKGPEVFDCSGYTSYIYRQFGIIISGGSEQQAVQGKRIALEKAKPGDLMFFTGTNPTRALGRVSHVAIIHTVNDSTLSIIHANGRPRGIEITYIKQKGKYTRDWKFWKPKYLYVKKIIN